MNITNITSILEKGINKADLGLDAKQLRGIEKNNWIKTYEEVDPTHISVFGSILIILTNDLIGKGFGNELVKRIFINYYKDAIYVKTIRFLDELHIYNFPLCIPVLQALCGEKTFILINGEGEIEYRSEDDLLLDISYNNTYQENNLIGCIIFDLQVLLKRCGIDTQVKSKGTIKKLRAILNKNMTEISGKYLVEYYTNPKQLGTTLANVATVPNRTTILKSNNRGAITHIKISTKKDLN